ncbi:MAG TPA: hypothetical protein VLA43_01200 [Longimicrobiales bacterium]|nr:hypothetical protein [Longimicrobiales bacterium]
MGLKGPWRWTGLIPALLPWALLSCFPALEQEDFASGRVRVAPIGAESDAVAEGPVVELQYLGVGGWRIETPHTVLLTAPLLTRPGLLEVGLGQVLTPDTAAILRTLAAWEVGDLGGVAAILVGHGHYDHLLDAPWIAARLAPRARILGNRTTRLQVLALAPGLGLDTLRVEDVGAWAASPEAPGSWIPVSRDVRVLPVRGDHAPHFAGHTLYSGVRTTPLPAPPGPASDWLDGQTLAFLVDVLKEDGSVGLRLYYHDGIPREPAGTLPPAVLEDGVPVHAAFLVPASFAEVDWHPEVLVQNLRPETVLVQHWEDFFSPALAPAEPVVFTILPDFMVRLKRVMGCQACVHLPKPGTRFTYPLR